MRILTFETLVGLARGFEIFIQLRPGLARGIRHCPEANMRTVPYCKRLLNVMGVSGSVVAGVHGCRI
jgi:hypothetical protein